MNLVQQSVAIIIMSSAAVKKANQVMGEKLSQLEIIINQVELCLLLIQKGLELPQLFNLKN